MSSVVDNFIRKFAGYSEKYTFYDGTVSLFYYKKAHVYLLLQADGTLKPVDGVTNTVHIIDKSESLVPWAAKMMAQKLFATSEPFRHTYHEAFSVSFKPKTDWTKYEFTPEEFEKWIIEGKSAHSDHLEEAGNIGHIAHNWIEQYIKAVLKGNEDRKLELLAKLPDEPKAANCCTAALEWMSVHNVRWISTERKVFSREYGYAGTMDGLCRVDSCENSACCQTEFKNKLTIADWKTSNYLYIDFVLQVEAYRRAYMEEHKEVIEDVWIIRLGKEEAEFEPWHIPSDEFDENWEGFKNALALSRSVAALNSLKDVRVRYRSDQKKEAKKLERAQLLRVKCAKADKFQGTRYPKCNGGDPCEACLIKFKDRHPDAEVPKSICLTNAAE
jgi:hypothetical protein